ncbi:MAG: TetR/AcrR family transcriptional regulator [Novosphingobium sp.]
MVTKRRMGPRDSVTSIALLDATERVLRNEGYGAASSRRVAEEAGLKQQLVYYYFHTMDELLLATFRRRTARALASLEKDIAGEKPVRALWERLSSISGAKLAFEFMALANHHEGIREEVARFVTDSRRMVTGAIAQACERRQVDLGPVTPEALAFLFSNVTLMLGREGTTGIGEGHDETRKLVEWVLDRLD